MSNSLNRNISSGEKVIVDNRLFICQSGFGMSRETRGSAIFGHFEGQENIRIDGFDIDKAKTKSMKG